MLKVILYRRLFPDEKMKLDPNTYRYLHYSAIGIEMAASVAVGGLIGYWLDGYFGTEPWWLSFWLICGVIAGFRSLYRLTKKVTRAQETEKNERPDRT